MGSVHPAGTLATYFDANAGIPPRAEPQRVFEAVLHGKTRPVLEDARVRVAKVLQIDPESVVFTSGGTEALALAIDGAVQEGRSHVVSSRI